VLTALDPEALAQIEAGRRLMRRDREVLRALADK
jgi:hypothetical protein